VDLQSNCYPQGQINFIIITIRQVIICHETSTEHCDIEVEQPYSHVDFARNKFMHDVCFQAKVVFS
jgi:hypothetical protein